MISKHILPPLLAFLCVFSGLLFPAPRTADAQSDTRSGPTPPRLSFIDGAVSFWRPGAEEWTQAQMNTALAAGDSLYAADRANMEIQFGPRAFLRAGADTETSLTSLDPDYLQFRITGGHAALDLKTLPRGQTIEIDTPNGAFTMDRPGYYRVDVDDTRTVFSARRGGTVTVMAAAGETTALVDNQQIILQGTEAVHVNVTAAPNPDEWDRWNFARTEQLNETPRSARYVPPDIVGLDELDRYGDWREQPRYGHVWVPRNVRPDWAPYSTGRWVYDPFYEWTWVDDAPWGWAPYHYGRWVHVGGFWGWAPGPMVAVPVYSPALVTFFGAPGIGVSVRVGLPFMSWCALGFGEPIVPWWGRRGFVGRPYWGGWGGPRVVNNVVIHNTRIVNVTNITKYQNVDVRNAVVAVDRNQFGRGRTEHIRLDPERVQRLQPVHGDLRVRPVAASLVPREARGQRPPDRLQTRQVVATRPAQDPMSRLRAKGIEVTAPPNRPEPRIVRPQRGPGIPAARPQEGVGAEGHPAGEVGAGGRPDRAERPQPGAQPASERAIAPPREERMRQRQPGRVEQPPPVPEGRSPGNVGAGRPERAERPQPERPQAAPQERAVPQPPAGGGSSSAREAQPSRIERPARPQAAPQERAVQQQPSRKQPAVREAQPSRIERPARPQAAPQERAVQQQPREVQPSRVERPARPQAAPQERAQQQQPSRKQPADGKPAHEAPSQER